MREENENYTEEDKFLAERPRKKRRHSNGTGYIYLFILVFAAAFFAITKAVKSYSPDVDVQIGNKEEITLNDDDMNFEARPIDERLKWIQSEDDLPVAGKYGKYKDDMIMKSFTVSETSEQVVKPVITEKKQREENEFKNIPVSHENDEKKKSSGKEIKTSTSEDKKDKKKEETANREKQKDNTSEEGISISVTRVYAGSYATAEEAAAAQKKLAETDPSITPFIKNRNGKYTIQAGSFYDSEKADALVKKLNADGFQAKKVEDK